MKPKIKKQRLYDMFDETFGDGHAITIYNFLLENLNELGCMGFKKIEVIIDQSMAISSEKYQTSKSIEINPIQANVKLLSGYSNFWENGVIVEKVESPLLVKIKKDTSAVFDISSRDFEKVVAEIYYNLGFDVELTPAIKDGGKDVIVVGKDRNGQKFVHFIECKLYREKKTVGVGILRELAAVVSRDTANMGIIVTTSRFTRDAKEEKGRHKVMIEFEEFHKLIERVL